MTPDLGQIDLSHYEKHSHFCVKIYFDYFQNFFGTDCDYQESYSTLHFMHDTNKCQEICLHDRGEKILALLPLHLVK